MRDIAQPGRARVLGTRCPAFESPCPDSKFMRTILLTIMTAGITFANTLPPTWENTLPPTWENSLPPTFITTVDAH